MKTNFTKFVTLSVKLTFGASVILLASGCGAGDMTAATPNNTENTSTSDTSDNMEKPLVLIKQFQFIGAFTIPAGDFRTSNANFTEAIIK